MKRVAALDVGRAGAAPVTVIPEAKSALADVNLVGGKLIAGYLVDARSEVRVYDLAGKMLSTIDLPGIGSAGGFSGKDSRSGDLLRLHQLQPARDDLSLRHARPARRPRGPSRS